MKNFRITYRPIGAGLCEYQSQIVEAEDSSEAIRKLYHKPRQIRSVTVQCAGTTKTGEPCQRFSHDDYCCEAHDPRPSEFEVSLNLHTRKVVVARLKGTKRYSTAELSVEEAQSNFYRGTALSRHPRTLQVDRLIACEWDFDELLEQYKQERFAAAAQNRREKFRLKIDKRTPGPYDESTMEVLLTRNGYQWQGLDLTDEEAKALIAALVEHMDHRRFMKKTVTGETWYTDEEERS